MILLATKPLSSRTREFIRGKAVVLVVRGSLRLVSCSKHKARWHSNFTLHGDTSLLFSVLVRSEIGFNAGLSDVAGGSLSTAVSWTGTSWHPRPSKQERIQAAVHSTSALQ